MENVRYWHFAHSFVRGNWRNSDITSPMFLAKCCHDMDILVWLTGQKCRRLSSFGGLSHFKAECAPEGAAMRCLDGCKLKGECPFDAEKIYITNKMSGVRYNTGWPNVLLTVHPTEETVREALEKGPYGRCVYHCDNNVVDHQVVNLEMESGLTITFSLCGLTDRTGRYMSIMGTKGYLVADMEKNRLEITRFGEKTRVVDFAETDDSLAGHGGGDKVLIQDFLDYLEGEMPKGVSTLEDSLESHFIAMAAEESRINGGMVVELDKYRFGGGW